MSGVDVDSDNVRSDCGSHCFRDFQALQRLECHKWQNENIWNYFHISCPMWGDGPAINGILVIINVFFRSRFLYDISDNIVCIGTEKTKKWRATTWLSICPEGLLTSTSQHELHFCVNLSVYFSKQLKKLYNLVCWLIKQTVSYIGYEFSTELPGGAHIPFAFHWGMEPQSGSEINDRNMKWKYNW